MSESVVGATFEEAIARLESVVARLESGDLSLDESLRCFEEGIALQRRCIADLDAAQRRIEVLTDGGALEPVTELARGGAGANGHAAPAESA